MYVVVAGADLRILWGGGGGHDGPRKGKSVEIVILTIDILG